MPAIRVVDAEREKMVYHCACESPPLIFDLVELVGFDGREGLVIDGHDVKATLGKLAIICTPLAHGYPARFNLQDQEWGRLERCFEFRYDFRFSVVGQDTAGDAELRAVLDVALGDTGAKRHPRYETTYDLHKWGQEVQERFACEHLRLLAVLLLTTPYDMSSFMPLEAIAQFIAWHEFGEEDVRRMFLAAVGLADGFLGTAGETMVEIIAMVWGPGI